jgi:DNA-binding NarL/FixJ family response regulator
MDVLPDSLRGEDRMQIRKVLIVDDDIRFRRFVKELFSSEKALHIIGEVEDGQEAILKAKEFKPDLVLMDISMPGMNGLDATRLLKAIMPELVVIILTIHDLEEYKVAATASGAYDYILKKSLMEDLIPAIRRAFNFEELRY